MLSGHGQGTCEHCGRTFGYRLLHNGFNESCYAYCARCGATAVIDTGYEDRVAYGLLRHRRISPPAELLLASCNCGGAFGADADPRCPHCFNILSALAAATWIERDVRGTSNGWKWQRNWNDAYAIIIDERTVRNPWRAGTVLHGNAPKVDDGDGKS